MDGINYARVISKRCRYVNVFDLKLTVNPGSMYIHIVIIHEDIVSQSSVRVMSARPSVCRYDVILVL